MVLAMTGIFILSMSASVFAATSGDSSKLDKRIDNLTQRQQRLEEIKAQNQQRQSQIATKAEQYQGFRQSLIQHRQDVIANREKNINALEQNNKLRLDLAQKLKENKDSGASLSDTTTAQLKADNAQIKNLSNFLKDTKGQIKDALEQYKGIVKQKDYTGMDTAFAQINTIQANRLDILNQINGVLQEMNNLFAAPSGSGTTL